MYAFVKEEKVEEKSTGECRCGDEWIESSKKPLIHYAYRHLDETDVMRDSLRVIEREYASKNNTYMY